MNDKPLIATTNRILGLILIALCCSFGSLHMTALAEEDSTEILSKNLIALRERISTQAEAVRSKRKVLEELERQTKIQSNQLEMQIAKTEARVKSLQSELTAKRGSQTSTKAEDESRVLALRDDIILLKNTIDRLPPIRKDERIGALTSLEQTLSKDDPKPLRGYNELIGILAAELDLATAVGIHRQLLPVQGQPTPVTLFHVGHSIVVFKTIDGRVGYVVQGTEPTGMDLRLLEDGPGKAEVERVVMQAQQGLVVSEALLPLTAMPLAIPTMGQDAAGEQNKL